MLFNCVKFAITNCLFAILIKCILKDNMMHELLSVDKSYPIHARFFDYQHFTYPWHFHPEYEIIYVRQSTGTRYVADSIEQFADGDLILLGQNVPHFLKSDPEFEKGQDGLRACGVIVHFEQDFMQYAIENYPGLAGIKALFHEAKRGVCFSCDDNSQLTELVETLPLLSGMAQIMALLNLLEQMWLSTARRPLATEFFYNHLSLSTDKRIEKVLSYTSFHYKEDISLKTIAALASMNAAAFCRYFKQKTGKSFKQYIIELRVGYACKLLANQQMTIFEVCVECGFNSLSSFNLIFKRVTGFTPSNYRQKMYLA